MLPAKEYHIDFDTEEMPGMIVAVRVALSNEIIRDDVKKMRVDLRDHPLYAKLERYVLNNPSRKKIP